MGLTKGRNTNANDKAEVTVVTLNSTTSVVLAQANPNRVFFRADNNGNNNGVWLKLQPASLDDDKKGIYLSKNIPSEAPGEVCWEMPTDNVYTGEICAIAAADSPDIYITEY